MITALRMFEFTFAPTAVRLRPRRRAARRRRRVGGAAGRLCAGDDGDARARKRGPLDALEVDLRLLVVEDRPKRGDLRVGQVALCLHYQKVRRHADLELAVLGLEPLLRELARRGRRLDALQVALNVEPSRRHLGGDLQLERLELRLSLLNLQLRPGHARVRGARTNRVAQVHLQRPRRRIEIAERPQGVRISAGNDVRHGAAEASALDDRVPPTPARP